MDERIPVDGASSLAWTEIAQGSRLSHRLLSNIGDPALASNFIQINNYYPQEKASDWCRAYLSAAFEHLIMWADYVAPFKFHPEHVVTHSLRPSYTLARAALEASAQAVWMQSGGSARECARRHLSLIRWDLQEHRKSQASTKARELVRTRDALLLKRIEGTFAEQEVKPPSLLTVIQEASVATDQDAEEVERVWRASSGAAHGKNWPSLSLQHVIPTVEYEPGQFRAVRIPDTEAMTEALLVAYEMTSYGALRFADFCGADIETLMKDARIWLAGVIPLKDDADPEVIRRLRSDEG